MITIECETGERVDLELDSLENADLTGLDLHRAHLESAQARGVVP